MNTLFYIDDKGGVQFSEQALAIKAFKGIWDKDLSTTKEQAFKELSFIYFIVSMDRKNPYRDYPKHDRIKKVKEDLYGLDFKFLFDQPFNDAFDKMIELEKSMKKDFLRTAIEGVHKLRTFLDKIDLDERDPNNKLIHDSKKYADNLKSTSDILKNLIELEKAVDEEEDLNKTKLKGDARREYNFS